MEAVNNMGTERQRHIDHEVKEIHGQVKRSSLVLKQRMKELQADLESWTLSGENDGENSEGFPQ